MRKKGFVIITWLGMHQYHILAFLAFLSLIIYHASLPGLCCKLTLRLKISLTQINILCFYSKDHKPDVFKNSRIVLLRARKKRCYIV